MEDVFNTKALRSKDANNDEAIHVTFMYAKWLFENSEWLTSLNGPKVIIEHDGYINFMHKSVYGSREWTKLHRRTGYDLLLCSGKRITEMFLEDNVPCEWLPKGYSDYFMDHENSLSGTIGYFDRPMAEWKDEKEQPYYRSRHQMTKYIRANCSKIRSIKCTYRTFPHTLSKYSAVCLNDACMKEPMAKHFECAAVGCVPIRDPQPELLELGYDERSMITYESFDELKEIVSYYTKNPDQLIPMQKATREVTSPHTWRKRVEQAKDIMRRRFA